jgi:hypothetical protein
MTRILTSLEWFLWLPAAWLAATMTETADCGNYDPAV